jgi:hypothetical protein
MREGGAHVNRGPVHGRRARDRPVRAHELADGQAQPLDFGSVKLFGQADAVEQYVAAIAGGRHPPPLQNPPLRRVDYAGRHLAGTNVDADAEHQGKYVGATPANARAIALP